LVNGKPLYFYTNETGLISTDFSNAGQIFLINTNNSVIDNLLFSNTTIGIGLYHSNGNTISNCEFKHNKQNDFELTYSDNNEIVGNTFGDTNENHLWLLFCDGNNITDNSITDDPVNNPRPGIVLGECNNNYVLRNDIRDCSTGIQVSGEYNTFSGNNLSNNGDHGLSMYTSGHNTISNNTLNSNWNGLTLESSDYNDILNNTMNNNREYGVFLMDSNYNTVSDNIFICNRDGCWADEGGTGNTFNNNICEECPEGGDGVTGIPGYNLTLIIGVISIISAILLRKKYKH
jgi:parallel beta-helix repeat protein